MKGTELLVRQARPEDAGDIARIHIETWRTAYAGLMPAEFLAALSWEERRDVWAQRLADDGDARAVFVAETPELQLVGFAVCGEPRSPLPPFEGELHAMYVLKDWQGRGAGRALLHKSMDWLMETGYGSMFLWVLEGGPARSFYESTGGRLLSSKKYADFGGRSLLEVAYAWDDLSLASKALEPRL